MRSRLLIVAALVLGLAAGVALDISTGHSAWAGSSGSTKGVVDQGTNGFRLTLTTATPVTTADVTAADTIYLTPYTSNRISIYNGSTWDSVESAEISQTIVAWVADTNYDIFAINTAGVITFGTTAWTNDTTRATALVRQDGVWCKTGTLTQRYLGTVRTTATTTTEDSEAKRFVFNASNRVTRIGHVVENTSHSYTTNAWRAWNNTADATTRVQVVQGLYEGDLLCFLTVEQDGTDSGGVVVGTDSTTASSFITAGTSFRPGAVAATGGFRRSSMCGLVRGKVGFSFYSINENGFGLGSVTFGKASLQLFVEM